MRLRLNRELSVVTGTFNALQEQRELADYDHAADFTRQATLNLLDRARAALTTIAAFTPDREFADFCGLVALRTSLRNR